MADRVEESYKVEPLKGSSNYRTWKFSMKMSLEAKDLWEIVSGEEAKPAADAATKTITAWDKKARRAMATIVLSISAEEQEERRIESGEFSTVGRQTAMLSKTRKSANGNSNCH